MGQQRYYATPLVGKFSSDTVLPNTAGGDTFALLRGGDTARVGPSYYTCVDPTPGAAHWLPIGEAPASGVVFVRSLADLPTPVGDTITLVDGVGYQVRGFVDVSPYRIVQGRALLRGRGPNVDALISNHPAETIFYDAPFTNGLVKLLVGNVGGGNACTMNALAPTSLWVLESCVFLGGVELVSAPNFAFTLSALVETIDGVNFFDGSLRISGLAGSVDFTRSRIEHQNPASTSAGIDIEATGTVSDFVMEGVFITTQAGSVGIRVVDPADAAQAFVNVCRFLGAGAALSGLTKGSNTWYFAECVGVPDSIAKGLSSWIGAAQTVDLPGGQAWVDVAGGAILWALAANAEKFSLVSSANGELEYTGVRDITVLATTSVTFVRSTVDVDVEFALALDGAIIPDSIIAATATLRRISVSLPGIPVDITQLNRLKLQVRNVDGIVSTADIDVDMVRLSTPRLGA